MTVNCVNIGKEEYLNIANINLLVRFKKTREIFQRVTWVLSILLTTAATSANVERVNSKEPVPKVLCLIWAASYGLTDSRCMWMKSVLNLSWLKSLWLVLYDKNLRHERVNALLLAFIQWDIILDYDKIIDIYTSKYQRAIILINPLSKN